MAVKAKQDHRKAPPRREYRLYVPPDKRIALSLVPGPETPIPLRIAPRLAELPGFLREQLIQEFDRRQPLRWAGETTADAPDWLRAITRRLIRRKVSVAFDVDKTDERAAVMAAASRREKTYPLIERIAKFQALAMPTGTKESTPQTIANRCYEAKTWRRIIDLSQTREAENCLRDIGFIERRSMLYCSDLALEWWHGKQRAQLSYLKSHAVRSDAGEQLSLFDVRQKSVSNPAIRRAELMTRMSGFEDIAKQKNHVADFWTLTAPSAYHSTLSSGGTNPAHEGYTPREAQAWLSKMWSRSRSKLARLSILVYGFRIAEPHHDGTPHWHLVLFCLASDRDTVRRVLREHWLSDRGSEPGAHQHRTSVKAIDAHKGSATGYISKYIAKNIDGFDVGEDFEAISSAGPGNGESENQGDRPQFAPAPEPQKQKRTDAADTATRVRAWASLHGIRQFQQIGGPTVTLYRELRRIRDHPTREPGSAGVYRESRDTGGSKGLSRPLVDVVAIERARVPADAGDWAGYVDAVGGIEAGRKTVIRLWKERTGECNLYDEVKAPQIRGIESSVKASADAGYVDTRLKAWHVVKIYPADSEIRSALGLVSITVRSELGAGRDSASDRDSVTGPRAERTGPGDPHGWTNPNETSMYGPH
jgi:Bacteriophage replication gene A protein (GPA)